jgi:predicted O-linked N-acetylglucosamine transferase (SPINDLY family)
MALGRFTEALTSFDRGLALRSDDVKTLGNKAATLVQLRRPYEALACCSQALAFDPDYVPALITRGMLLREATRFNEALIDIDRALKIDARDALAWNDRGATLHAMNRDDEALASFEKAVNIKPDFVEALTNRGYLRWTQKAEYVPAVNDLIQSIALDPDQPYVYGELVHMKMQIADWTEFERDMALIDAGVREGRRVVRPFVYQALSRSPSNLQACSRIFATDLFPNTQDAPTYGQRNHHRKIKVGYVSGEFRQQATAQLLVGLYEQHDRNEFEIIAIDNGGPDASPMRKRLEAAFDDLIDISKLADEEAADRIRAAEIDILVNLNGYFGSPRMGVFAKRPAPVQVNYLGFPATLGATYIDYIIADSTVIPKGERRFYDERVVWLPHSYQANDRRRVIAENTPNRATLGLPEDAFVFCNFNQSYKLTPQTFASWMRIVRSAEGSVLWLLRSSPLFAENLTHFAQEHGVTSDRLIFAPPVVPDQHLARLKQANLFLDSLPYNAHTTASDALWASLPLLTFRGTAFPGRVASSLLYAIGLPELVTDNLDAYEALALKLACDPSFYQVIKQKLAYNRLNTPLFDTNHFCRDIEAAYRQMWEAHKRGEIPRGFSVKSCV